MLIYQRLPIKPIELQTAKNNFIIRTKQEALYHGSRNLKQECECHKYEKNI